MHQMRMSTTQVSSVMLRSKKMEIREKGCENWKSRRMKTKQSAMKLSQIRRRIELCLREIYLQRYLSQILEDRTVYPLPTPPPLTPGLVILYGQSFFYHTLTTIFNVYVIVRNIGFN
jgi:hypothetical protein